MRKSGSTGKLVLGLVSLLALALVAAACGGGGIESDELSSVVEQSVAAAVAAAVPEAAPAGASVAEISAMVRQAVESAAPEGVSAAEIGTLVEAAVAAAAQPAVSAQEIESLVTQAVEQAAAEAATPLSASEVEDIVAAAVAAIPVPEPVVIAMPTAAPVEAMEVVLVGGTYRGHHHNAWGGMEELDPASPAWFSPLDYMIWDPFLPKDFNTGRPTPEIATSWETNSDATQWTFSIRQGITHSDDTPLTAADVIFSTLRHLDPNVGSGLQKGLEIIDVDAFETPDDYTLVYNLNSGHVDFPLQLTPPHYQVVPDGSVDANNKQFPIGSGPFILESASVDGISVLTARQDYWNGTPLLGRITIVNIGDSDARVNATLAGQIDHTDLNITPAQASLFEGDPEFYVQESPRGQFHNLVMITTEPPFDDVRVRQALKLVVDPQEMIAVVLQGHGTPACNNSVPLIDQYNLPLDCPQDIEGARALLAEAGYPDGLTVEFVTSNQFPAWVPIATVYKEQAALAGITIEIREVAAGGYWSEVWMVEPFGHSLWGQQDADYMLGNMFRCGAAWNETFWCSEEFDALLIAARAELDFDGRRALYQQAQQLVVDESGMVGPFFSNRIRAVNVRLQGMPEAANRGEYPYHEFYIVAP